MTELLLSKGANPQTRDSQRESALERAASHGDVAVVQSLLDGGVDPNAAGRDTTPLAAAAYQGHTEVIALLLARGADASRSVPGSRVDGNGAPLAMALLPQAGQATVDLDPRRLQALKTLVDQGADVDASDNEGRAVLHSAASRGQVQAVDLLLSRRARVDPVDKQGLTPLHLAVKEGHAAVVARLLDRGADIRIRARDGRTALDFAAGDPEMEDLLRRYAKR